MTMTPGEFYWGMIAATAYLLIALWAMDSRREPCWIDWCWRKIRDGVAWVLDLPGRGVRRLMSALSRAYPTPGEARDEDLHPIGQARCGDVQDKVRRS